jgi:hypothetical protein
MNKKRNAWDWEDIDRELIENENVTQKDKSYPLSDNSTIAEVESIFDPRDIIQLQAWGDVNDDRRWGSGDMALKYIQMGFPVKQVLVIVAKYTDASIHTVKKYLACSRYYAEHPVLRNQAGQWLRYSIMQHAARYHKPVTVINYAIQNGSSPAEIERLFPVVETLDDEDLLQTPPSVFGIEYKAFKRWFYNLFNENDKRREAFDNLLSEFMDKLQKLIQTKE